MRIAWSAIVAACIFAASFAGNAWGQYSQITTPFHNLNDSFFERIGVGFGFTINTPPGSGVVGLNPAGQITPNGINFNQGGFNSAIPTIGGYDPNSVAQTGFSIRGPAGALNFNIAAGQGSNRTYTSQAPTVVIPNGGQGSFSDTTQRPFVTSIIPVVGDASFGQGYAPAWAAATASRGTSPLFERMNRLRGEEGQGLEDQARQFEQARTRGEAGSASSRGTSTATHGDLSVAEIRRQQAQEEAGDTRELNELLERARGAEEAGKASVAKIYYRQALARAKGTARDQIESKLRELGDSQQR